MRAVVATIAVFLFLQPASGWGEWSGTKEMREFLLRMQDMETPPVPLRGDVSLEFRGPEGSFKRRAVILQQPGTDGRWYLELGQEHFRAIVDDFKRSSIWRAEVNSTVRRGGLTGKIGGTGLIFADLGRFVAGDFKEPRILDENPDEIQVGMYPAPDVPYVYRVYTIDKRRGVPVKIQYFAERLNNLAKVRLDSGHVKVYDKWLPTRISFKNFADGSEVELSVKWSFAESLGRALFDAGNLAGESPLRLGPAPESEPKPAGGG